MQDKAIAPDPVPLRIRTAGAVYESLLVAAIIFIASMPFAPLLRGSPPNWLHHLYQLYLLGALFLYFALFWRRSGQTLAMKTWRIRLVAADGGLLSWKQSAVRFGVAVFFPVAGMGVMSLVSASIAGVAWGGLLGWAIDWFSALADPERRCLHDRMAGTRLVRVPRPA